MRIVFDSSTLILLAKISMLRMIAENFNCIITEEVRNESVAKKDAFDAKIIMHLEKEGWLSVSNRKAEGDIGHEFGLGPGEASALGIARKEKIAMATDDKCAIMACKVLDVKFVTSVDFVISAYDKKKLSAEEAREKIRKLDEYGRYSAKIIISALEKIGDDDDE